MKIFDFESTDQKKRKNLFYENDFSRQQTAQAMKEPTEDDWIKVKRIFRYLQGTKSMKIIYSTKEGKEENQIIGYSDASYAEDRKDRKSTSGYLFIKSNGPII